MGRNYHVWYGGEGTVISIRGDLGGWLSRWSYAFDKYTNRVIRHTAYMTQMRMKAELLAHAPGGQIIPEITEIEQTRWLDAFKRYGVFGGMAARGLAYGMNGGKWPIAGKLTQAIGYEMHGMKKQGEAYASIGWLSQSAARLGSQFQRGGDVKVTDKMRKFFWAAGLKIGKNKTFIKQPSRPVMFPFYQHRKGWICETMLRRFHYYFQKDAIDATRVYINREFPFTRGFNDTFMRVQ